MIRELRSMIINELRTAEVEAMLDTFTVGEVEYPAIFAGMMIPETFQGLNRTLLVYHTTPLGPGEVKTMNYTVNCRQETDDRSVELAEKVQGALNRVFVHGDKTVYLQATIQPAIFETERSWNSIVEIHARNNF